MDWPSLVLITYAFLLALLLAVIILRSVNASRGRYQRLLEEKEQKLSEIQLDLEETMDALGDQATALELALKEADQRERAANQALQQRLLEVQGAVVSAQSRLLRLEQGMEEMRQAAALPPAGIEIPAEEPRALPELPQAEAGDAAKESAASIEEHPAGTGAEAPATRKPRGRKPRASKEAEAVQPQPEEAPEEARAEEPEEGTGAEDLRERLAAMFEQGGTVAEASRAAGCSSVEAAMIYNQWKRGYFSEDVPGR